uniref:AlNc14C173G8046 protein n=1 Tax=Albugo laibachii Nc14 TaxID=890382 RepID=F0WNM5_9STRA|nr:AlNc14C173G8046 [Albugo laibachii Nc14]|eukprot:CCA22916.1 AlNc14C173G8046 [Albugo laibachii Nc14]
MVLRTSQFLRGKKCACRRSKHETLSQVTRSSGHFRALDFDVSVQTEQEESKAECKEVVEKDDILILQ